MKTCPNCKTQLDDSALFCTTCGVQFGNAQPQGAVPLSRMQYLPSKMLYRLSRVQFLLRERMRLLQAMIRMIIRLNLILRIYPITRFLLCFVTLWILSASLLPSSQPTHQSTQCSM